MLFPRCEKAAYVPSSPAHGSEWRCPWLPQSCGMAEQDPKVPVMPCGTSTGPQQCVPKPLGPAQGGPGPRVAVVGTGWHQVISSWQCVPERDSSISGSSRAWESHIPAVQGAGSQPCTPQQHWAHTERCQAAHLHGCLYTHAAGPKNRLV